jgi:hypothetical protein
VRRLRKALAQTAICLRYGARIIAQTQTHRRCADYLLRHADLNAEMRTCVVIWLKYLTMDFGLRPETSFHAMHIFDSYLGETRDLSRQALPLLSAACLFLASKQAENRDQVQMRQVLAATNAVSLVRRQSRKPLSQKPKRRPTAPRIIPRAQVHLVDDDVIEMEATILEVLQWRIHRLTAVDHLHAYYQVLLSASEDAFQPDATAKRFYIAVHFAVRVASFGGAFREGWSHFFARNSQCCACMFARRGSRCSRTRPWRRTRRWWRRRRWSSWRARR